MNKRFSGRYLSTILKVFILKEGNKTTHIIYIYTGRAAGRFNPGYLFDMEVISREYFSCERESLEASEAYSFHTVSFFFFNQKKGGQKLRTHCITH
jgi:hypothetical protein